MVNGEFTDDELRIAKLKLKAGLLMRCDTQSDKVENISESLSTSSSGVAQLNEMYNLVDAITKEDIINASKNIFSQKPIYSIRASQDTLNANKEYLDKLLEEEYDIKVNYGTYSSNEEVLAKIEEINEGGNK